MNWKKIYAFSKKSRHQKSAAVLLAFCLAFGCCLHTVNASKITDAENKRDEAQEGLDEVNQRIDEIQAAQSELQEEMEAYDDQLMMLLTDMELLEQDVAQKQLEIEEAEQQLVAAQETERTQYDAMKVRIQYMYENGDQSYWSALIGAESITELLNRAEYVSEVYDYDRKLLAAYQETVAEVELWNEQLGIELAEMEELQISYEEQEASLEGLIAEKSARMEDFGTQLAAAQNLAGEYAQTIREQNQIIADEEERLAAIAAAQAAAAAAAANNGNASGGNASGGGTSGDGSSGGTGLVDGNLDPAYTTGVSGSDVVAYATQFVGNPYVYGGNSLTEGADCSYFVMAVFQNFGISLPRNSYAMQKSGQAVSYNNARAGDIICYSGHVALYMGDGKIVHASSPSTGICYGNATYRTIVTIRRVL